MAKLSENLKRILTNLADQHSGEFLSAREKIKALVAILETPKTSDQEKPIITLNNTESNSEEITKATTNPPSKIIATKHIAFISNGEVTNAPLEYAIELCQQQSAQLDVLINNTDNPNIFTVLEKKIHTSGVRYQQIQIEGNAVEKVIDYVVKQPSLIFIISTPVDVIAKTLI